MHITNSVLQNRALTIRLYSTAQKYHTILGHNCEVRKALPKNELDKHKAKQTTRYGE